jgi:NAD(P)-dependent dehydrogenase (short-subunit alcohol dehydrogenase family)
MLTRQLFLYHLFLRYTLIFGGALYTSSKAALESYARTVALELAPKKIRVNVLQPALVRTNIYEDTVNAAMNEEEMKKYEKQYPLGIGDPQDVANMIVFFYFLMLLSG